MPIYHTWSHDCIEYLLQRPPRGIAHVDEIAIALDKRGIKNPKETITRTLNSYCSDARDYKKGRYPNLFERVAPNTFRLRSYPRRPPELPDPNLTWKDLV
jgi:hypothetical protein